MVTTINGGSIDSRHTWIAIRVTAWRSRRGGRWWGYSIVAVLQAHKGQCCGRGRGGKDRIDTPSHHGGDGEEHEFIDAEE
jgi:hypothetical protein